VKKTLKKGEDVRDRILSPSEFNALMQHTPNYLKSIIAMGYYSGMRRGEITGLTWNKVDLQNRVIKLESSDTKDREKRTIPILPQLFEILVALPNRIRKPGDDNHVFLYQGQPIKTFDKALKTACENAGIKYGRFAKDGFKFHDLRHTFNTNMRKAGVSESVIMKITGHSTRQMFDRYNTIDEFDMQNAVDRFEKHLSAVDHSVDQDQKNESDNDQKALSDQEK
jgi:integrase